MTTSLLEGRQAPAGPGPAMSGHKLTAPYPPTNAALGGVPTVSLDVPMCAVFLVLFIVGAASHMTILQVNMRRGHKFILSGMMFGFCMSRIVTMIMRIVWATRPTNIRIAIAANIFVYAGVVLLFVVNVLFAQRIVRACHPNVGWSPFFHYAFIAIYVLIVATLLMLVTSVIQSFYTLNHNTKRIDRDILLYGQTFYAIISFLPFPLVLGGLVIPRKTRVEKFGQGRFREKVAYLLSAAFLLCLGASFRVGTNYAAGTRPREDPASYQSKACFYIFNFVVEIIVILLYVIVRVDKRFYVPDQSKKPGDYSRGPDFYTRREQGLEAQIRGDGPIEKAIAPEEEVFDDMSPEELAERDDEERDIEEGESIHEPREPAQSISLSPIIAPLPNVAAPSHGREIRMSR